MTDVLEQLHASLDSRLTPESVAGLVLEAIGEQLTFPQRRVLQRAADSRAARYSSMSSDFERPAPAKHKVQKLADMLGQDPAAALAIADDPWKLGGEIRQLAPFVGWRPEADFKGRMNRAERAAAGVELGKRPYNRLVRHLIRLNKRIDRLAGQILLRQLLLVGHSGLAATITLDDMRGDVDGACFVAYWVAQKNRRREFTLAGRDNPFDEIAQVLLDRCVARGEATDWWMVARAYPHPVVVARLDDEQLGHLMGRWSAYMQIAGDLLAKLYDTFGEDVAPTLPDSMWDKRPGLRPSAQERGGGRRPFDRSKMVVRQGMDSSTWNTVAGAYNAARAGWINCLGAAGALELLDVACPGKVMRLMAADLVYMHGGQTHPDTAVWATLPLPWEVLRGDVLCGRETVELVCQQAGVDPEASGWTAPRQVGEVAAFKPTKELVHGVEVADPLWAGLLRRAGAFAGRKGGGAAGVAAYLTEPAEQG